MEQEGRFLESMGLATGFEATADHLVFWDASGRLLLFTRSDSTE